MLVELLIQVCLMPSCAALLQAVRRAVLDLTVELIATSSTFIGNCLQVCSDTAVLGRGIEQSCGR